MIVKVYTINFLISLGVGNAHTETHPLGQIPSKLGAISDAFDSSSDKTMGGDAVQPMGAGMTLGDGDALGYGGSHFTDLPGAKRFETAQYVRVLSVTGSPSMQPSTSPSTAPSQSPSTAPSTSPSLSPSTAPSTSPSVVPSTSPSLSPSTAPSAAPSAVPSTSPSLSPSTAPSSSRSPSTAPSLSPSTAPSAAPSAVPSTSPSISPSVVPSTSPSLSPSTAPSAAPSAVPSTSPSISPSAAPSISSQPSTSPSISPSTSPSISSQPTTSAYAIAQVALAGLIPHKSSVVTTIPGNIIITAPCTPGNEATDMAGVQAALELKLCPAGSTDCKITIKTAVCVVAARAFRGLSTSTLNVDYEVKIAAKCAQSDCSDAEVLSVAVKQVVQETANAAVADGSLVQALPTALGATAVGAITQGVSAFELLADLTSWYPTWHNTDNTCSNDGNAPAYMTLTGNFIYGTLESCCNAFYSWSFTECMKLGGATSATYATNEFYVDYTSMSCKQSCEVGTAAVGTAPQLNCAGIAPSWMTVFATAELCCKGKLWWLGASACVADSTLIPATAGAWGGDWYKKGQKCVKDCDVGSDSQCGGMAERWDEVFSSSSACCTNKLWWVEPTQCT